MSLCERTGVKVGSKQGSHLEKEVCGICLMLGLMWVSGPLPAVGVARVWFGNSLIDTQINK